MLEIHLLGEVVVLHEQQPVEDFVTRKEIALLAYLACTGREHNREVLADFLWDDRSSKQARSNLRTLLSYLRRHIGDHLKTTRTTATLDTDSPYWLDVATFNDGMAIAKARQDQYRALSPDELTRLSQALHLYRGDFMTGFHVRGAQQFEEWMLMQAEVLRRNAVEGYHLLTGHYMASRDYNAGIANAARLLVLAPFDEAAHRKQMTLLALSGQRSAALDQYDACRSLLWEELHVEPEPQTTALYRQISEGALGWSQTTTERARNPYKGLRAFHEDDTQDFFGRETVIESLLARMGIEPPTTNDDWTTRFLAVVGPSGSGKSSIVRAGLIPILRRLSRWGNAPWTIVTITPRANPQRELTAALHTVFPMLDPVAVPDQSENVLANTLKRYLPERSRCLLVIDQFEELFTLTDNEKRQHFLDQLLDALQATAGCLWILVTLRADYYDQPLRIPRLAQLLGERTLIIPPLSQEELQHVIVGPARNAQLDVEPALVTALIADSGQSPGALPLLQYALTELFERCTTRTLSLPIYREIGGLAGALVQRINILYDNLTAETQALTQQIFLHLVEAGRTTTDGRTLPDTRRRVKRAELTELASDPVLLATVLNLFSRYRFITFDHDPTSGEPTVEIAHESLIEHWDRLRAWLDDGREVLRVRRYLTGLVKTWYEADRDPSYLVRGQQLARLEMWAATSDLTLSATETTYLQAALEAEAVRESQKQAQLARETALRQRAQSLYLSTSAQLALNEGHTDLALALALHANRIPDPPPQAQLILSEAAYAPSAWRVFRGHRGAVESVAFSPDGLMALSGSTDRSLILWNLETGDILRRFTGHTDVVHGVAFLPDGVHAISASGDGSLIVWDVDSGDIVRRLTGHSDAVWDVAVHPDGRHALSASADHTLRLWDVDTGQMIRQFMGHQGMVYCVSLTPGHRALSGSADGRLLLWDINTGEIINHLGSQSRTRVYTSNHLTPQIDGHQGAVRDVVIDPTGHFALSVSEDLFSLLWDLDKGVLVREYQVPRSSLFSTTFIAGIQLFAVGTMDSRIALLNPYYGTVATEFLGHQGRVLALAVSPDNNRIVSGAADGTLRLWNLSSGAELRQLNFKNSGASLALSADGKLGLVAHWTGEISLWDYESGRVLRRLAGHTEMAFAGVKFSADGRIAISGSGHVYQPARDNTLRVWEVATGQELQRFEGHTDRLWDIDLSPDGRFAVSGSHDGTVRVWDIYASLETGRSQGRILADFAPQAVRSVAISPDGHSVLIGLAKGESAAPDYRLHLVAIETGASLLNAKPAAFSGHTDAVQDIVFCPHGGKALSGGHDKVVILWDIESGRELQRFIGHAGAASKVAFIPDHAPTHDETSGCIALSAGTDNVIILWDIESGAALRRYHGHQGGITGIAVKPGGHTILSTAVDDTVREWRLDLDDEALMAWIADNRYVPELTDQQREQYHISNKNE